VKDQGNCGSCWALAATAQIESDAIRTLGWDRNTPLSAAQLTECAIVRSKNGCTGDSLRYLSGFNYATVNGITTDASYPYDLNYYGACGHYCKSKKCSANAKINVVQVTDDLVILNEQDMAAYVQTVGPVIAIIDSTVWQSYKGGTVIENCESEEYHESGKYTPNHAVQFVGVDTTANPPYWKVRNSWGTNWGEKGFMRMKYGVNMCGLFKFENSFAKFTKVRYTPPSIYTDSIDDQFNLWEKFKIDYEKNYYSPEEEERRFETFLQMLKQAAYLNAVALSKGGNPVFGITKFSDLSPDEFKRMYLSSPPSDVRRLEVSNSSAKANLRGLSNGPATLDLVDWTGSLIKYDMQR
jgi:hypothetical protein